jgi:hypothetical protein
VSSAASYFAPLPPISPDSAGVQVRPCATASIASSTFT